MSGTAARLAKAEQSTASLATALARLGRRVRTLDRAARCLATTAAATATLAPPTPSPGRAITGDPVIVVGAMGAARPEFEERGFTVVDELPEGIESIE